MTVTIDPHSGFCFGVVYAIDVAERELQQTPTLYCLGDIVHNNMEVNRLKEKGLVIISREDLENLRDCKVMIRAHGEPPETYQTALRNNIELVDASCPIVLNLQNEVRQGYEEVSARNGQVVIYGKEGHAEVNGLKGQTNGEAIIVGNEEDLDADRLHPAGTPLFPDHQECGRFSADRQADRRTDERAQARTGTRFPVERQHLQAGVEPFFPAKGFCTEL